ncbi:hypothetical protein [Cytobacillus pseudoceanisediminis]|uniref:hypothetical protein n=1 Tax=Cytobacillus pseudoceanisediminis TaxID=3051614 RepID=UPI003C2E4BCD
MLRNHTPKIDSQIQQEITRLKSELAKYQSMLSPKFRRDDSTEIENNLKQMNELINKNATLRKKLTILSEEDIIQRSYLHNMQESVYELHKNELTNEMVIEEDKDLINKLNSRIYELELSFWEMHYRIQSLKKANERLTHLAESETLLKLFEKQDNNKSNEEVIVLKENKRLEQVLSIEIHTITAISKTNQIKTFNDGDIINSAGDS